MAIFEDDQWLRAENWQDLLRDPSCLDEAIREFLEKQNQQVEMFFSEGRDWRAELYEDMKSRIVGDDSSVPLKSARFQYQKRFQNGSERVSHWRIREDGEELLLLDENIEATGRPFFRLGQLAWDRAEKQYFWSADFHGSEFYEIMLRDADGQSYSTGICDAAPEFIVCGGGTSILWVRLDEKHRPKELVRSDLIGKTSEVIYREPDDGYFMSLSLSGCGGIIFLHLGDHETSEVRWLFRENPEIAYLIKERKEGVRYWVDCVAQEGWYLLHNENHPDFSIDKSSGAEGPWEEIIAGVPNRTIRKMHAMAGTLCLEVMQDALPQILVMDTNGAVRHCLKHDEPAYDMDVEQPLDHQQSHLRLYVSSPRMPLSTFDVNVWDGTWALRKTQEIPSGHCMEDYELYRFDVVVRDGEKVPVTLIRHKQDKGKKIPLFLYGYGAYGMSMPAYFSTARLALVDRHIGYAIIHIRGGMERGWDWYQQGKKSKKTNSFFDFIDVSKFLSQSEHCNGAVAAHGGSAGGMLMGAICNMAPEIYRCVIAEVPFVDVLATMSDPTLPLTPPEWPEWGNPIEDDEARAFITSYSPVDNVTSQKYPAILATAGLTDPRVTYWEPARWVKRLQQVNQSVNPILLHTDMDAGHAGKTGRYQRLEEVAQVYAFALRFLS